MPPAHWRVAIYHQGHVYETRQILEELRIEQATLKAQIEDMKGNMSKHLVLTQEQKDEVTAVCKCMVFEPTRSNYDISAEVVATLRSNKDNNGLKGIFKSPAHVKILTSYVRRQSSYARNHYRKHLKESIADGKKKCGISKCVREAGKKLLEGVGKGDVTAAHALRIAILRHFIRNHPHLMDYADEDEPDENEVTSGPESSMNTMKKRKRAGGRAPDGQDFWGLVTKFIEGKNNAWGVNLKSEGWSSYINQCLAEEHRLFPDDKIPLIPIHTISPSQNIVAQSDSRSLSPRAFGATSDVHSSTVASSLMSSSAFPAPYASGLAVSLPPLRRHYEVNSPSTPSQYRLPEHSYAHNRHSSWSDPAHFEPSLSSILQNDSLGVGPAA
ncbi:hypothetical protein EW026_g3619 [Hermanssonia centrifuga]|uniref:Uncharacterized protein n=1 Tax=Hermanssonia centrifuga TaxID=98765 RepID=A0A4S4KJL1_9APHY|nr:hypothetical protein EW026_g3619 [Hermanssonia centrifuga]